uniref:Uncharacterized protein n=1 Tax=Physcomitrium patens TaxID=3218 RepID=A0A2K1J0A1_PHYPA|nr:hypothetical protein PHYPA_022853 [Physcomitrium patens]
MESKCEELREAPHHLSQINVEQRCFNACSHPYSTKVLNDTNAACHRHHVSKGSRIQKQDSKTRLPLNVLRQQKCIKMYKNV